MSFFGNKSGAVNFQDTYDELGQDEDQYNDETFGADVSQIRLDFQFASPSGTTNGLSYAAAAATKPEEDGLKPLDLLWGGQSDKKPLLLAEIEAGLGSGGQQPQAGAPGLGQVPNQGQFYGYPGYYGYYQGYPGWQHYQAPPGWGYPGYQGYSGQQGANLGQIGQVPGQLPQGQGQLPQGQVPGQVPSQVPGQVPSQVPGQVPGQPQGQAIQGQVSGQATGQVPGQIPGQFSGHGQIPGQISGQGQTPGQTPGQLPGQPAQPGQSGQPGQIPGQFAQVPGQIPGQFAQVPGQFPQGFTQQFAQGQAQLPLQQYPAQAQAQSHVQANASPAQVPVSVPADVAAQTQANATSSQLNEAPADVKTGSGQPQAKPLLDSQFPPLGAVSPPKNRRYSNNVQHASFQDMNQSFQALDISPEQAAARAAHQERIYKYLVFMTPRDKDFVTRYQILRIVTDDPFNEDFYFQIFKAIRLKSAYADDSLDLIAKYYLEHSGHRLGGKHSRADVALQRMQQQVSRAVSVAKERQQKGEKGEKAEKEAAFGRVAFTSGRAPRKQLNVEVETKPASANVPEKLSKKLVLQCLEKTYSKVLELEADKGQEQDASELWESLHIGEDGWRENIFVSFFNFEKGLKLFPRVVRYLTVEQSLKVVENVLKKLSLLRLLHELSYPYYYAQSREERAKIDGKVELFLSLFLKFVIAFDASEMGFDEIVKMVRILLASGNVAALLPTKIGLSLMTVLVSKMELIRQDLLIVSQDQLIWAALYEQLFNAVSGKLMSIFPQGLYTDDAVSVGPDGVFDDSYIWHFLASMALTGKINHKKVIVDEVREKVFECVEFSTKVGGAERLANLNLFLNVMGLNASEDGEITAL